MFVHGVDTLSISHKYLDTMKCLQLVLRLHKLISERRLHTRGWDDVSREVVRHNFEPHEAAVPNPTLSSNVDCEAKVGK